jgi:glucose-1-phosphate cytidylyltransferase
MLVFYILVVYSPPDMEMPPVVIFCGGKGTRLREKTEFIPKPLVEIGGMPILWHVMKIYSSYGCTRFILCLGYKAEKIKEYFLEYAEWRRGDFTLHSGTDNGDRTLEFHSHSLRDWDITFVETGLEANKGTRLRKAAPYIQADNFFVAYGDDLARIHIKKLHAFHQRHGAVATVTCVQPASPYGIVTIDRSNSIVSVEEKPPLKHWINGGFFVFTKGVFDYLADTADLEKEMLPLLAKKRQVKAYKLHDFWRSMNTYQDTLSLNELWHNDDAPWKIW